MIPCEYITDIGILREINEDSCQALSIGEYFCMIIADGIGGLEFGEEASRTAVDFATSLLQEQNSSNEPLTEESFLNNLFNRINAEVYKTGLNLGATVGIGTTLTLAILKGNSLTIAHVGDSRAYMVHGSSLIQLTQDNTIGDNSHILSKSLGENNFIKPDIYRYNIMYGDLVLLCTDGLHSVLKDDEILLCIKKHKDLKGCLDNLVKAVYTKDAPDNVTIILAHNKPVKSGT